MAGRSIQQRGIEEVPENGKESSHSAHANGTILMHSFHSADFHETHDHWLNFSGYLMYQTSSKLDEKCRKYGKDFIYDHK